MIKRRIVCIISCILTANKVMISDPHFVGCAPPSIRPCCRTGIICAIVCCAYSRITFPTTQGVTGSFDSISIFPCVSVFGNVPSSCMRSHTHCFVLVISTACSLVDDCIKRIRIPRVVYSVDNTVCHS